MLTTIEHANGRQYHFTCLLPYGPGPWGVQFHYLTTKVGRTVEGFRPERPKKNLSGAKRWSILFCVDIELFSLEFRFGSFAPLHGELHAEYGLCFLRANRTRF